MPEAERLVIDYVFVSQYAPAKVIGAGAVYVIRQNGARPEVGTALHVTWSSCGNVVKEVSGVFDGTTPDDLPVGLVTVFGPDNSYSTFSENSVNRMIGRSVEYALTVTQPGYDPFVLTGSYGGYTTPRPSCEVINSPGYAEDGEPDDLVVEKWSIKKGDTTARVGGFLKVTPTKAPGSEVSYRWRVGRNFVDRDRILSPIKTSFRGKRVALLITVSKSGSPSVSKTLRFGTVR